MFAVGVCTKALSYYEIFLLFGQEMSVSLLYSGHPLVFREKVTSQDLQVLLGFTGHFVVHRLKPIRCIWLTEENRQRLRDYAGQQYNGFVSLLIIRIFH